MIEKCHLMAKLAGMAYLDGQDFKNKSSELGFYGHKFFEEDGAQCHVLWNNSEYVMAFRGTEPTEPSDLLADLNAWPDKGISGGRCHNGFQNEVEKFWKEIKNHYEDGHLKKNLYITGHSLGGAMATVAAYRMNKIVDALYTYGSPRVGTRKYIKQISCPHYRHVNNNDAVTAVPPFIMGYKHHGTTRYINHYGNIRKLTFWQRFKDKLRGYRSGLLDPFTDHSIDNYIKFTKES